MVGGGRGRDSGGELCSVGVGLGVKPSKVLGVDGVAVGCGRAPGCGGGGVRSRLRVWLSLLVCSLLLRPRSLNAPVNIELMKSILHCQT